MGLIVYLLCCKESKAKVRAVATENILSLKGSDEDTERTMIIYKMMHTIAYEIYSKVIGLEGSTLNHIHQRERSKNKNT